MYVGEHDMGCAPLKTRLKKLALKVCSECKRSLGGVLKACDPAQACMCEGAPVWTQYIAISTIRDDPRQCEHVLS